MSSAASFPASRRRSADRSFPSFPSGVDPRDRAAAADVRDRLENDGRTAGADVELVVSGGVVHMRGVVADHEQRRLLRRLAATTRGIDGVWDYLLAPGESRQTIVDIGCGGKKQRDGAFGIDRFLYPGVDLVSDLENGLPFASASVDQFFAVHFLEHVRDLLPLMNEIHRVLKPDGVLHVMVPNCNFVNAVADPTHVRFFNLQTFKFFCRRYPGLRLFRPVCASEKEDNLFADLEPVQEGEAPADETELARFFS